MRRNSAHHHVVNAVRGAEMPLIGSENIERIEPIEQSVGAARFFDPWIAAATIAVAAGLGAAMWSATISAGLGRFAPVTSLAIGAVTGICCITLMRSGKAIAGAKKPSAVGGADAAFLLLVALVMLRAWPPAIAWPAFLDGGWYAASAALVARQGGLNLDVGPASHDVFVMRLADQRRAGLGVPVDENSGFHAVAFAVSEIGSGNASPYHPPFFAGWLAIFAAVLSPDRLGAGAWPWAAAWILGLGLLARRTVGREAAPWAVAIAGVSPLWHFFSPQPFAELTSGALILAGLALLAQTAAGDDSQERAFDRTRIAQPFLAGLLLGLAALTKLDAVPIVASATGWWLWTSSNRSGEGSPSDPPDTPDAPDAPDRRAAVALIVGLMPAAVHAAVIALGPSAVYYKLNLWGVRSAALGAASFVEGWSPAVSLVLALGLMVALAVTWVFNRNRTGIGAGHGIGPRVPRKPVSVGAAAVSRADVEGAHRFSGAAEVDAPAAGPISALVRALLAFGPPALVAAFWLRDLPAEGVQSAPPSMSTILVWAITPLGAWAALATWTLIVRRADHSTPFLKLGALSRSPLAPAALATAFVLAAPLVTRSLSPMYVGRRLLLIAFPLACILAAAGAAHAWRRGGAWRAGLVTAAAIVAAVQLMASEPLSPGRDLSGARLLIDRLEAFGEADDVFVFPSSLSDEDSGRLASAVWALNGRAVAVVGSPEPELEALSSAVLEILDEGRQVFWIGTAPPPTLDGVSALPVGEESVITEALAPDPTLPPRMIRYEFTVAVHELELAEP